MLPLEGAARTSSRRSAAHLSFDVPAENRLNLLEDGSDTYMRMLAAIGRAQRYIRLATYRFSLEHIGERFLDALASAARHGVAVHVVLDGLGTLRSSRTIAQRLGEYGCTVEIHHPLSGVLRGEFGRLRRRMLVIDDEIAYVGAIDIDDTPVVSRRGGGDEPAESGHRERRREDEPAESGHRERRREDGSVEFGHSTRYSASVESSRQRGDDLVLEIEGPVCRGMGRLFYEPPMHALGGAIGVRFAPLADGSHLLKPFLRAVARARRSIWIAYGSALPEQKLVRAILSAARRGVCVHWLSPDVCDAPFAHTATRHIHRRLLSAGVRLYVAHGSISKSRVACVDGRCLLVCSPAKRGFEPVKSELIAEITDGSVVEDGEQWIVERLQDATSVSSVEPGTWWVQWFLEPLSTLGVRVAMFMLRTLPEMRHLRGVSARLRGWWRPQSRRRGSRSLPV
ncbi:MAG: phospholipase D-like domain-containing protein [Polyangiaceae bacterium]